MIDVPAPALREEIKLDERVTLIAPEAVRLIFVRAVFPVLLIYNAPGRAESPDSTTEGEFEIVIVGNERVAYAEVFMLSTLIEGLIVPEACFGTLRTAVSVVGAEAFIKTVFDGKVVHEPTLVVPVKFTVVEFEPPTYETLKVTVTLESCVAVVADETFVSVRTLALAKLAKTKTDKIANNDVKIVFLFILCRIML